MKGKVKTTSCKCVLSAIQLGKHRRRKNIWKKYVILFYYTWEWCMQAPFDDSDVFRNAWHTYTHPCSGTRRGEPVFNGTFFGAFRRFCLATSCRLESLTSVVRSKPRKLSQFYEEGQVFELKSFGKFKSSLVQRLWTISRTILDRNSFKMKLHLNKADNEWISQWMSPCASEKF